VGGEAAAGAPAAAPSNPPPPPLAWSVRGDASPLRPASARALALSTLPRPAGWRGEPAPAGTEAWEGAGEAELAAAWNRAGWRGEPAPRPASSEPRPPSPAAAAASPGAADSPPAELLFPPADGADAGGGGEGAWEAGRVVLCETGFA
jgi:hypothetical protein